MKSRIEMSLVCALTMTATLLPQEAKFVRVTEAQARQAVATAAEAAKGDTRAFTTRFDQEIKKINADYEYDVGSRVVLASDALLIYLSTPVAGLRLSAENAIRKFDPPDKALWIDEIEVRVAVRRINAPDIVKIVVTRDGKVVEPLRNTLVETEQTTRMGAKTMLHEGGVVFPAETFDPGAVVIVTAVPSVGQNVVKKFTDKELRKIQ